MKGQGWGGTARGTPSLTSTPSSLLLEKENSYLLCLQGLTQEHSRPLRSIRARRFTRGRDPSELLTGIRTSGSWGSPSSFRKFSLIFNRAHAAFSRYTVLFEATNISSLPTCPVKSTSQVPPQGHISDMSGTPLVCIWTHTEAASHLQLADSSWIRRYSISLWCPWHRPQSVPQTCSWCQQVSDGEFKGKREVMDAAPAEFAVADWCTASFEFLPLSFYSGHEWARGNYD